MKVGFIGLGKLGLPCALAAESKGVEVRGFDPKESVREIVRTRTIPYREEGAQRLLNDSAIEVVPLADLVKWADILFVAVETPHDPIYEGTETIPVSRADFDYTALKRAMKDTAEAIAELGEVRIVAIISTVLPGTVDRELRPLLNPLVRLAYNPFFIAMGTTVQDYLYPEFMLLGADHQKTADAISHFYRSFIAAQVYVTGIREAELAKVAYNTAISFKILHANALMELCHKIGCDLDGVVGALKLANRRILGPRYMDGGVGDGGGCHIRDAVAMSWLAQKEGLSVDVYDFALRAREKQTTWLAQMAQAEAFRLLLPIVILGKAYKPESNLVNGSCALLLAHYAQMEAPGGQVAGNRMGATGDVTNWDPHVDGTPFEPKRAVYVVATKHPEFRDLQYPEGSVVLDPFRYVPDRAGVRVVRIGGGR